MRLSAFDGGNEMTATLHRLEYHRDGVRDLLNNLYRVALFESSARSCYRRNATMAQWALDLRKPLSVTEWLVPTARAVLAIMSEMDVRQVSGKGIGAFYLVGGITAVGKEVRSCMIRNSRKQYGFREIIEGFVDKRKPIVLVDDLLASGATLCSAADVLRSEGFNPVAAITIFKFGWHTGTQRLLDKGIIPISLATLHYRSDGQAPASYSWEAPTIY